MAKKKTHLPLQTKKEKQKKPNPPSVNPPPVSPNPPPNTPVPSTPSSPSLSSSLTQKPQRKAPIPAAFREQIWLRTMGRVYEGKCPTPWCQNRITVHDFQSGHNIPESKGGPTTPENLIPLCSRCNQSMGNQYTFDEWARLSKPSPLVLESPLASPPKRPWWKLCC